VVLSLLENNVKSNVYIWNISYKRVWKTKFILLFVYMIFVRKIKRATALCRVGHLTWCLSDKWYVPKNRGITWGSYSLINLQKSSANEWDSLEWNKLELKKTKFTQWISCTRLSYENRERLTEIGCFPSFFFSNRK
jgi:hypothetical protein